MNSLANQAQFVGATSWTWQQHLKGAIRDAKTLRLALNLPPSNHSLAEIEERFPTFVPLPFLSRIEPGNPADPLLRQVLPTAEEGHPHPDFNDDPVSEAAARIEPGLLKKYPGRVLLIAAKTCGVNCRYCFRRAYPYGDGPSSQAEWLSAIEQVGKDSTVQEVILSGGDPLINSDSMLAWFMDQLEAIPHIRRLRIHTRLPVVIPQRVTSTLLDSLRGSRFPVSLVVHINHAREIDSEVQRAISDLRSVPRLMLLNQSVLLQGVNDSVTALVDLSWRLTELGIVPYYLHQLDRVAGTAQFEVPTARALELIQQMRAVVPGYLVPRLAQEIPGAAHKTVLA